MGGALFRYICKCTEKKSGTRHLTLIAALKMVWLAGRWEVGEERSVDDGCSFYPQCLIFSNRYINYQCISCIIKTNILCVGFFLLTCLWGFC